MKWKELMMMLAVQALVGILSGSAGVYVTLQVTREDIRWIKQIQINHEQRIEAMENQEWRRQNGN